MGEGTGLILSGSPPAWGKAMRRARRDAARLGSPARNSESFFPAQAKGSRSPRPPAALRTLTGGRQRRFSDPAQPHLVITGELQMFVLAWVQSQKNLRSLCWKCFSGLKRARPERRETDGGVGRSAPSPALATLLPPAGLPAAGEPRSHSSRRCVGPEQHIRPTELKNKKAKELHPVSPSLFLRACKLFYLFLCRVFNKFLPKGAMIPAAEA